MRALKHLIIVAIVAVAALLLHHQHGLAPQTFNPQLQAAAAAPPGHAPGFLPPEALTTLQLIAHGGPFPHRQDGIVFENRERQLPFEPSGYYHEYTVDTPGLDYRGARRIITGGSPPTVYYYTDDHYRTFRRFEAPQP